MSYSGCITGGFMKRFPSVYTLLMNTIYTSHRTQVAKETFFRKYSSICEFLGQHGKRLVLGVTELYDRTRRLLY